MIGLNTGAPTRPRARSFAYGRWLLALLAVVLVGAAIAAVALRPPVLAQTPPPAPKAQPKAKAPPPQPAPAPPPAAANTPATPAASEIPPLSYTPWTKLCRKGQEADAKQVCATSREGFLETGFLVVGAVLIEPEGVPTKVLQITLPLMMALQPGTRVIVDQGQPINAPFSVCMQTGCIAEIEASGELVGKLKKGQTLFVQGVHMQRAQIMVSVPLAEFAKANEGAPTDPKVYEDRMKKLNDQFIAKQQALQQQGH